jgi:hypothetical protein
MSSVYQPKRKELANVKLVSKRHLNKKQSDKIKLFAKRKHK